MFEAELQLWWWVWLAARVLWLTAEQFRNGHFQGFGGALDEIERRVAGAAFVPVGLPLRTCAHHRAGEDHGQERIEVNTASRDERGRLDVVCE